MSVPTRLERFSLALETRPDIDPISRFHMALLGACACQDPQEFLGRIPSTPDPSQGWNPFLTGILAERFASLQDGPSDSRPLLGFVFAGSYRHQLMPLAKGLAERGHRILAILDHNEWKPGSEEALAPYLELPAISLSSPELMSHLGCLGAVFAPDTAWRTLEHLPREVRRVALQHGLTAVVDYSISYEGGGTTFDHILLTEPNRNLDPDLLRGVFPRSLVRHGSDRLALVPAGWPKLDQMIHAFQRAGARPARKVVVHLSVQDHDSLEGMRLLPEAIERILSWEPAVEVLLRPFPGVSYPFAESLRQRFQNRSGFGLSTAESYVEDYKDASALITLKETTAEIFPLATGIPSLCLIPEKTPGLFARGRLCATVDDLLEQVRGQLEQPGHDRERIFAERDKVYLNPGRCLDALHEAIPSILAGESPRDWTCLELFEDHDASDLEEHRAALEKLAGEPRYALHEFEVQVLRSALERFGDSVPVLVPAARCLLRIARRHQGMRPGQRLAAHHLCFAEIFLQVFCALEILDQALPHEHPQLHDAIQALRQDALQMSLVLEWAQTLVPGYRFGNLEAIRAHLASPGMPAEDLLAAISTYQKAHHNLPFQPQALAQSVLSRIVERATKLLIAGSIDRAERAFQTIPRLALSPQVLHARLQGLLTGPAIAGAPKALRGIVSEVPDINEAWNALAVTLAETSWTQEDIEAFRSFVPGLFAQEDRLANFWNAAAEGRNTAFQRMLLEFLASREEVPRELLDQLRASLAS